MGAPMFMMSPVTFYALHGDFWLVASSWRGGWQLGNWGLIF
jgi:hypothetical protein